MENSISVKEIGAIKDEFYLTENNGYTLSFKVTDFEGKEVNLDDLGLKCTSVMYLDEGEINSQDVPSQDGKLQLNVKADTLKDQNETELRLFFYDKADNKPSLIKNFKIKPNYTNNSVIVWDYAIEMNKVDKFTEEFYNTIKGAKGDKGERGQEGKSAYEVAVANGFKGSESEWLESLKESFKPKEAVATFNDLPKDAELKELRGVTDENAVYVYDGAKWIKQSQLNFDGLSEVKKEVAQTEKVILVENYGAVGDGVTDDSNAFFKAINAFPQEKSIKIMLDKKRYKLNKPIYISRRVYLEGQGQGHTILDYTDAILPVAPYTANILGVHEMNVNNLDGIALPDNQIGRDGRYSVIKDFTVVGGKSKGKKDDGFFINTPLEVCRVEFLDCGKDGVNITANTTVNGKKVGGNANHVKIRQTKSMNNGGNGINILGADANTFVIDQATTYYNDGVGIYDGSFLGGVVLGAEADGNKKGAFQSAPDTEMSSRTVWLGTYAESNHPFNYKLSSRHVIYGATGALPEKGQNYLGGLVDRGIFSSKPITIADDEQAAYDFNGTTSLSARLGDGKLELHTAKGKAKTYIGGDIVSANYYGILTDSERGILFPYSQISNALKKGIPYFPNGFTHGLNTSYQEGVAPPTTGNWSQGQRIINDSPAPGGYEGWVCVTSGSPGVWKGYGLIQS